jgi:tRNA pseudouridine38-40 synthase
VARLADGGALALERLKLVIAYDGRPFTGWQSQAGKDGVQDRLEAAFARIVGADVRVHGSGRTDAGVHARAQIAHADVPAGKFPPPTWLSALNANLPAEIRVLKLSRAPGGREGFHARYDATGKRYEYRIWNEKWLHPLEIGRVWHVPHAIDLGVLKTAAQMLEGRHDFAGFAANRGQKEIDTVREVREISVRKKGPLITLRFEGNGFLYKMVRLLTGTLVRIAQGKTPIEIIPRLLKAKGREKTQFAAPAEGLYLTKVFYGRKPGAPARDKSR